MSNIFDQFRYNKHILEEVNEAVDIFNDPKSNEIQQAMAYGAILMEKIICEELRDMSNQ